MVCCGYYYYVGISLVAKNRDLVDVCLNCGIHDNAKAPQIYRFIVVSRFNMGIRGFYHSYGIDGPFF